jgi:hypothetical protein
MFSFAKFATAVLKGMFTVLIQRSYVAANHLLDV